MIRIFFLLSILVSAACHYSARQKWAESIRKLPKFQIVSSDGTTCIKSDLLPIGRPTIFIYFEPDCEHCQFETEQILKKREYLKNANIYFITNADTESLKSFRNRFMLDTIKNIVVAHDQNYSFYRAFLPAGVPYIAIYNGNRDLARVYQGETNVNSLINMIR